MHRSIPAVAVAASLLATISCGGVSEGSESASTIANSVATTSTSIPDEQPTTSAPAADMATSTTTSPRPAQPSLAGFTVVIDPGHNGQNWNHPAEINAQVDIGTKTKECDTTGTQSYSGYSESDFTFDLSERLRALLEGAGATVVMTRSDNAGWGPCITERAAIGNDAGADVAISIHADGGPDTGRGFHVIYPASVPGLTDDIAVESERLALALHEAYGEGTGMPVADYIADAGLSRRDDLGGLNLSDVPKVFMETGNMRNAADAALLADPEFRDRAAAALAGGITVFLLEPSDQSASDPHE